MEVEGRRGRSGEERIWSSGEVIEERDVWRWEEWREMFGSGRSGEGVEEM